MDLGARDVVAKDDDFEAPVIHLHLSHTYMNTFIYMGTFIYEAFIYVYEHVHI